MSLSSALPSFTSATAGFPSGQATWLKLTCVVNSAATFVGKDAICNVLESKAKRHFFQANTDHQVCYSSPREKKKLARKRLVFLTEPLLSSGQATNPSEATQS